MRTLSIKAKLDGLELGTKTEMSGDLGTRVTVNGIRVERDYEELTNKPLINSVEVSGSKDGSEYHLQNKLTAGDGIVLDGTIISQNFATYNDVINFLNT